MEELKMPNWNWPKLIEEQKHSRKTIAEFCDEKGVHYTSFYKNRKKLLRSHFVEIKNREKQPVSDQPITLKYKDFSIEIPTCFNKQTLKDFLSVLGEM